LRELVRRCPSCQADLDLLVDYVNHLRGGLERAEDLTRSGQLGQAVWAYLEVLEVDPDNATAKKQVAQVATAVRQFDRSAPGRKWLFQGRNGVADAPKLSPRRWLIALGVTSLVLLAFMLGFMLGGASNQSGPEENKEKPEPPPTLKQPQTLG
jgi:hypothetical protein